jgi:hypothetical protein
VHRLADPSPRDDGGEKGLDLAEPLVERKQVAAALEQELLPKLVASVHLEDQAAEVAKPRLALTQERAALAPERARGR